MKDDLNTFVLTCNRCGYQQLMTYLEWNSFWFTPDIRCRLCNGKMERVIPTPPEKSNA